MIYNYKNKNYNLSDNILTNIFIKYLDNLINIDDLYNFILNNNTINDKIYMINKCSLCYYLNECEIKYNKLKLYEINIKYILKYIL